MSSETTTEETQMSETTMQDQNNHQSPPPTPTSLTQKLNKMKITPSFTIWPPTQRTRDAVTNRLIETLSTPSSVLSKRYGTLSIDEASLVSKSIEQDAFAAASNAAVNAAPVGADVDDSIDGGIEILQVYSKEISKRVLLAVKSNSNGGVGGAGAGGGADKVAEINDVGSSQGGAGDAVSEEVSNADDESQSA